MNRKGFTLIELILVIAILGILAISALPKFIDISSNASTASMQGVVGAVRSGIALYRANDMVTNGGNGSYPTLLDANAAGACTNCFTTVLSTPVSDTKWTKSSTTAYVFNNNGVQTTYTYNATTGTLQ